MLAALGGTLGIPAGAGALVKALGLDPAQLSRTADATEVVSAIKGRLAST
jgi:hypothetical protein